MSLNKSWSRQKKEKRITRMIFLMIMAFNISWLPYAFVCTLKLVQHNFVPDAWAVPGLLLAKWYLFRIKYIYNNQIIPKIFTCN